MASLKIVLPSEVDAINPVSGDLFLTPQKSMRLTQTLREEVAQQLYIRFRFFQGEWFLDGSVGVPWKQSILGVKVPIGIVSQILRNVCARCPGVAQVQQFQVTPFGTRRQAKVAFSVLLTDGAVLTSSDYGPFIVGAGV